jgi:hypothetical protein
LLPEKYNNPEIIAARMKNFSDFSAKEVIQKMSDFFSL